MAGDLSTRIDIQGMRCAACARTVEDAILDLDGVSAVTVNEVTDEATVSFDPDRTALADIYSTVNEAGYHAVSERHTIGITDMHCADCARTVERALASVPGVIDASVNYVADEATVEVHPSTVERSSLTRAIEAAGYNPHDDIVEESATAETDTDSTDVARSAEISHYRRLTLFGAVLTAPLVGFLFVRYLLPQMGLPETIVGISRGWIEFLLATPIQIVLGWSFYRSTYTAIVRNRTTNMDVLIALGPRRPTGTA